MTLTQTSHEHHSRLLPHVDRLLEIAGMVGDERPAELRTALESEYAFVTEQLVPHMEAAEKALYPQLDMLLEDPTAMAPMRREHAEVRRLIGQMRTLTYTMPDDGPTPGDAIALRRVLTRLHGILKVHLAEEEHYLPLLERHLSDEERHALASGMEHAGREPL